MTANSSSQHTRDRLLAAAAQEILETGFAGASLANIAARIGYTKGSLGYHFPTKETILDGLLERLALTDSRAARRAQLAFPDQPSRALVAHIGAYSFLSSVDHATAAASVMAYDRSIPHSYGRASFTIWQDRLRSYLEAVQEKETYQLTISPTEGARRIMAATTGDHVTSRFCDDFGPRPRLGQLRPALFSLGFTDIDQIIDDVRDADFFYDVGSNSALVGV